MALPWMCRSLRSILLLVAVQVFLYTQLIEARKHHLEVRDDTRPYIALSTFGFYIDGHLDVKLSKLSISDDHEDGLYGLSLDKTTIDQMNPYLDSHQNKCILEEPSHQQHSGPILFFILDRKNSLVHVQCSPDWNNVNIFKDHSIYRDKRQSHPKVSGGTLFMQQRKRRAVAPVAESDEQNAANEANLNESVEQPILPAKEESNIKASSPMSAPAPPPQGPAAAAQQPKDTADANADKKSARLEGELKSKAVEKSIEAKVAAVQKPPAPAVVQPADNQAPEAPKSPQKQDEQVNAFDPEEDDDDNDSLESEQAVLPVERVKPPPPVVVEHPRRFPNEICRNFTLPLTKTIINEQVFYNMSFYMRVATVPDIGLYNLYFHACPNYVQQRAVSFDVDIEENNNGNYLSAGDMPLPALYFMMSLLFFLSGLFWVFILKKSKHSVYKIHYIMAVLVFLKSLSLMFHSINYHFIEIRGEHVEAWAILYYIAHLLKGAVLFITIVLIGTGWTFIKHILSDKDKKIFMIVLPLQVLANVAKIIIDESEESDVEFRTWHNIFIFVDLLCCGAILFPIVWSIRHLHEASTTDGKAAINLRKLKLFRQFYIMIVCYIYFTRIIVYLLKVTVAFQYIWLDEMFHEMATYVFFVLTGYKFRPASSHPYFSVPAEDMDDDEVEVLTESGLTEGLHRTKALNRSVTTTTIHGAAGGGGGGSSGSGGITIIEGNDDEREQLISRKESSHEYD